MYYWQINDGRIWSADAAAFVESAPAGADVTPLYDSGQPGGVEYLRDTIKFYHYPLGDLAGPEERKAEILAALAALDQEAISLRTLANAALGDEQAAGVLAEKMAAHEAVAAPLRAELAAIAQTG
jgi:hypothetical protein